MEYAVGAIWMLIEIFCLYFSCKAFLPQRRNNIKTLCILLGAGLIIFCINNLKIYPFSDYPFIQKGVSLAICLIASFFAFGGPWYSHLLLVALYYFSLGAVDTIMIYGTAALLGIPVSELVWRKFLYTVIVAVGKCVLTFLAWSLFYFRGHEEKQYLNKKKLILMFLFPFISIVMLFAVFDSYKAQSDLSVSAVIFSFILIASNAVVAYLMISSDKAARAEQELAILNQSMALQTRNIYALEKSYRTQRAATHEFKHQLHVISDLLEAGDISAATDYVKQLQASHSSRIFAVNTNHPIVDAVLNEKYHLAKENSIDINYKVNDLSALPISADSLVVLLSNLLDNAIEACQKLPNNRAIECKLLLEDALFLSIRNTSPHVEIVNGTVETTKEPKREHGFGLAGVRRIIRQLNGDYAIDSADNYFQFVAEIPIK